MVFTPRTWTDNEVYPASGVNRLEQGIAEVSEALDGKVDGDDPRLTDARTPTAHTHPVSDVTGLATRLDALERDTGFRSIPHLGASGAIHVSRTGKTVTIRLVDFVPPAGNYAVHVCALPTGFRWAAKSSFLAFSESAAAPASLYGMYSPGQLSWSRTLPDSNVRPTAPMQAEYRFTTTDAWPTTLPGDPT